MTQRTESKKKLSIMLKANNPCNSNPFYVGYPKQFRYGKRVVNVRAPEGRFPIGRKSPLKERALGFVKMGPKRPLLGGGTLL